MVDANATIPGGAEASYMFAVWNLVIRPPRTTYDKSQLGPAEFEIGSGIRGQRRDVRLRTERGFHLECSHFIPRQDKQKGRRREWQRTPVVIYLHGNASSRLEAGGLVAKLLERNISLFCFDWAGCGISEGDYISLGWHERDDLATVIGHLRESQLNGPIGVWGRSMGAVTALMHADRDPTIAGVCLDSPFSSLRDLIEEIAQSERLLIPVPQWLVNGILSVIRMRVKTLAHFDIEDLVPIDHGPKSSVPALFLHGLQDNFVLPRHSEKLYNNYAGDKEIMMFDGDHNNERSAKVIDRGVGFLCRAFRKYELEFMVSQHLADVHSTCPLDGSHRIPHLPRQSTQPRKASLGENNAQAAEGPGVRASALGDITNCGNMKGPGARANEVEAVMNRNAWNQATEDSIVSPSGRTSPSNSDTSGSTASTNRRPAPRKFASSVANQRVSSPTRNSIGNVVPANGSKTVNTRPRPEPLIETTTSAKGDNMTPRGTPSSRGTPRGVENQENRRPRSKGPTPRSGSYNLKSMMNALASRGGA